MEFETYHGLVIVHPDFPGRPKNPGYLGNLYKSLDIKKSLNICFDSVNYE